MQNLIKLVPYKEPQYFINEKKGIVVAICLFSVNNCFHQYDVDSIVIDHKKRGWHIEGKGIARCSPSDTFDVEKGKKIARAKAEQQAFLKVRDRLNKFIQYAQFTAKNFNMYARRQSWYLTKLDK